MRPIIALVGPSKAGKTTLIVQALHRLPSLVPLRSITTRVRRVNDATDDIFYEFVDRSIFNFLRGMGELIEDVEYAGNWYGIPKLSVGHALNEGTPIGALTEHGVEALKLAGCDVKVVRVWPFEYRPSDDESRVAVDNERIRFALQADKDIVNSFRPGGLEAAADELMEYLLEVVS